MENELIAWPLRLGALVPNPNGIKKMDLRNLTPAMLFAVSLAASPANAAVYTISDFSHNANTSSHFDFGTDWSGTPGIDNIAGEDSLYVKFTVSWSASSDPGDFIVRYALDDGGGRSRADADFRGGATQIYLANANGDGDGAGPATVQPTITIDTNSTTSVTFVMKVDQTKPSPGGDWNYGTIGAQDNANAFLYVDPNLGTTEANNSTILAGWRSGQSGYDSLSFVTSNLESGNSFSYSDIVLYTGEDTPFAPIPEPSVALLGGIGLLSLLRLRRRSC